MASPVTTSGDGSQSNPYVLQSGQSNITLQTGKYYVLQSGSTLGTSNGPPGANAVALNGASLTVQSGAAIHGQISFGSAFSSNSTSPNGSPSVGSTPGSSLIVQGSSLAAPTQAGSAATSTSKTPSSLADAFVSNFGSADRIQLTDITVTSATSQATTGISRGSINLGSPVNNSTTGLLIAVQNGGQVYSVSGGTIIGCFLKGTHIATRNGEVLVEDLKPGDEVAAMVDGETVYRRITWVGSGRMNVAEHGYHDSNFPVRIKAGAFAPNMPHRDLLLTSEHCVFVEGKLVPVRMLVNRQSIAIDRAVQDYEYFHIQLEEHGILISEGLTTESYLDAANRERFDNLDTRPEFQAAQVLAAPLAVDRQTVEPIWNRLYQHARDAGLAPLDWFRSYLLNTDLRVVLDDGTEVSPAEEQGWNQTFVIPEGRRAVSLLSNKGTPADIYGPFVDDRRELGVAVDWMEWSAGGQSRIILASDLSDEAGWHDLEGAQRWTNGAANIDLPAAEGSEGRLVVNVAARITYPSMVFEYKAA